MRLLDGFCGAGGAAKGYQRAGFYVVGVDIKPQPRYCGDEFHQGDALAYIRDHGHEFDVIHTSPPCQVYSVTSALSNQGHLALIDPTRTALLETGKPYIIENVPGAPLTEPLMLCGTMFGLRVIRHRLFETSPRFTFAPASCNHWGKSSACGRGGGGKYTRGTLKNFAFITVVGNDYIAADGRKAMGIDWMTKKELSQAIPPAYTEFIGRQLMDVLRNNSSACYASPPGRD